MKKKNPVWPLFFLLGVLGVLLTVQYFLVSTQQFVDMLREIGLLVAGLLGMLSTFIVAMFLYFFRCRWLYSYGFLEIIVGFFAAIYVVTQLIGPTGDKTSLVFAEIAALYVMVRGLDNVGRALSGKEKEDWDKFFFGKKDT